MIALATPLAPGERDVHLLVPDRSCRVLVVGGDDVGASLAQAGHDVTTAAPRDPWGSGYDLAVIVAPSRMEQPLGQLLDRAGRSALGGSMLVVDRPRWSWPELVGRRRAEDRGRRPLSARRVERALRRRHSALRTYIATPHLDRLRHLVEVPPRLDHASRERLRRTWAALWAEARLPAVGLTRLLGALPRRAVVGTAPVVVWVVPGPEPVVLDSFGPGPVAFLGSPSSPVVTVVSGDDGRTVTVHSPEPGWSPHAMVDVAGELERLAVPEVRVARHRVVDRRVVVDWVDGRVPVPADDIRLAIALGNVHARLETDVLPLRACSLAQGRLPVVSMLGPEDADLADVAVARGWTHGDWSARNLRVDGATVAVFDLEFADARGPIGFDIAWLLLTATAPSVEMVAAYERAAGRRVTAAELRLGRAVMAKRYGPDAASVAWTKLADAGILAAAG